MNCKQELVTTSKSCGFWCPSKKSYPITVLQIGPGHSLKILWLLSSIQDIISYNWLENWAWLCPQNLMAFEVHPEVISYHWIANLAWLCPLKFMSLKLMQEVISYHWIANWTCSQPQNLMTFQVHPRSHILQRITSRPGHELKILWVLRFIQEVISCHGIVNWTKSWPQNILAIVFHPWSHIHH